jgi:hypothetical protein
MEAFLLAYSFYLRMDQNLLMTPVDMCDNYFQNINYYIKM